MRLFVPLILPFHLMFTEEVNVTTTNENGKERLEIRTSPLSHSSPLTNFDGDSDGENRKKLKDLDAPSEQDDKAEDEMDISE